MPHAAGAAACGSDDGVREGFDVRVMRPLGRGGIVPGSFARDTFQILLLVALGDLLLDIRRDALVGFVKRGLAGNGLAEPADHRVEDHAVVDIALQLVGNRGKLRHAFAEDLERGLGLRRSSLVLEPLLREAEMAGTNSDRS